MPSALDPDGDRTPGIQEFQQGAVDLLLDAEYEWKLQLSGELAIPQRVTERKEWNAVGRRGVKIEDDRFGLPAAQRLLEDLEQASDSSR